MPPTTIHIKNMVCRRCVMTVEDICAELHLQGAHVSLGSVIFDEKPDSGSLDRFHTRLREVGFEPLQSHEMVTVEKIKSAIRSYARHPSEYGKDKLSAYIEKEVRIDFRYASRLFSNLEGRSVRDYLMAQKVEFVKELLFNNEMTLAGIADAAGFSSVAHLSNFFKKEQGMTISEFRNRGTRLGIDEI